MGADVSGKLRQAREHLAAGRLAPARASLQAALRDAPRDPAANSLMSLVCHQQGQAAQAEYFARQALAVAPDNLELLANLGNLLCTGGKPDEGLECLRRAAAGAPDSLSFQQDYCRALASLRRPLSAAREARAALARFPGDEQLADLAATSLLAAARIEEAVDVLRDAAARSPDSVLLASANAFALNYRPGASRDEVFAAHRRYGELAARGTATLPPPPTLSREPERPLRVGFISPDFRTHSVAYFVEPILEHLDRAAFAPVLFAVGGAVPDTTTHRLKSLAAGFHDCSAMRPPDIAALIRRERIDILIDLASHTDQHCLPVMRLRPAPVLAAYCGYPNTTGLPVVQWRLVDALTDPPGEPSAADRFATERLSRILPCFLCFRPDADHRATAVGEPRANSDDAARPITFGSFNALQKINRPLIALWARVLSEVPSSRLMLKNLALRSEEVCEDIAARFESAGVPRDRLELIGWTPTTAEHLALYARIDIALDTFPYHGTTTTCEALWMGVPVVTLEGTMHAGRVGVSLLHAVGAPELIARNEDEYVSFAVSLARDTSRLSEYRRTLRERVMRSVLCDGAAFGARFGTVLREMWRDHCGDRG